MFYFTCDRSYTAGSVRRLWQGVGPRAGAVQTRSLRPDSDAGQHDVYSDSDEHWPLLGYLSPATAHLQTEGDDCRLVASGAAVRHATTLHLQTGIANHTCTSLSYIFTVATG